MPTPRGGGLVFVFVAVAAALLQLHLGGWSTTSVLPLVALPLALIGLLDDVQSLPAGTRYGFQLATALVLVLISTSPLPWMPLALLEILAVTAVINFINFMDGLDGLAAGCMAIVLATAATMTPSIWPLVGALLGFLLWNWSPAKVFMGDVGSTFLGAVFGGLLIQAPWWPDALGLLLLATPLLGDASLCLIRRLLAGQCVFQAHRLHLFQRLHKAGWSHAQVSTLYLAATAVLSLALLVGGLKLVVLIVAAELVAGLWLDQHVAVPFVVASSHTSKSSTP